MNNTPQYSLKLTPPAFIQVSPPEGMSGAIFQVDLYVAWRMLDDTKKSPSEDARWEKVIRWLAGRLGIKEDQISESMAREFADHVYTIGAMKDEALKKKLESAMPSWRDTTEPDSQQDGNSGTNESSEPGETPSQPPTQSSTTIDG